MGFLTPFGTSLTEIIEDSCMSLTHCVDPQSLCTVITVDDGDSLSKMCVVSIQDQPCASSSLVPEFSQTRVWSELNLGFSLGSAGHKPYVSLLIASEFG